MTQLKYGFSHDDRSLVVEVLREAAGKFDILADDLEEDRDNPAKAAAYVASRLKGENCRRLAREIERDMALPYPHKRRTPHGAPPRHSEDY